MIYYRISLLIVLMISVVCFSADNPDEEENFRRIVAAEKCSFAMALTFPTIDSRIICIRHAFLFMKLHGDYAFEYNEGVKMYYESFHLYVDYDKIRIPTDYCGSNQSCLNQVLVFEETPIHELRANATNHPGESSDIDPDCYIVSPHNTGPNVTLNDPTSASHNSFIHQPSSSEGYVNLSVDEINIVENAINNARQERDIKKRNVMVNALYYHVIYDRRKEFRPPQDDAKKYFHATGTHGFRYLAEVAKLVDLDPSKSRNLVYPAQYCRNLYNT